MHSRSHSDAGVARGTVLGFFSSLRLQQLDDATDHFVLTGPLILFVATLSACLGTSPEHSLTTATLSWATIWLICAAQTDLRSLLSASEAQRPALTAGALFAIAQLCQRAAGEGEIWWAKTLLPLLTHACLFSGILPDFEQPATQPEQAAQQRSRETSRSALLLALLCCSALVALYTFATPAGIALAISYAIVQTLAICLVERARGYVQRRENEISGRRYSANNFSAASRAARSIRDSLVAVLRDVATGAAAAMAVATLLLDGFTWTASAGRIFEGEIELGYALLSLFFEVFVVLVHGVMNTALVYTTRQHGPISTSTVTLTAIVCGQLLVGFSPARLWFAALFAGSAVIFVDERGAVLASSRMKSRGRVVLIVLATASFVIFALSQISSPFRRPQAIVHVVPESARATQRLVSDPPRTTFAPLQLSDTRTHPIEQLVRDAQLSWNTKLQKQSRSLSEAVTEYRRRYEIPPPPNFDKWYEFAKQRNVLLIDDYDNIHDALLPFWALRPATIRGRAREAMGFSGNGLMAILIRDGKVVLVEGGADWIKEAAAGMMEHFTRYLPDMDLIFNLSDEPRVVVPHDELARLVRTALNGDIGVAASAATVRNQFSPRPKDLGPGKRIEEVKTTRFSQFAHQPAWISSRMSCPLSSPARPLEESYATDNLTAYALGELGFVYNQTAFSDICNSPSLATSHGFFDRPNSFNVVHELFPVFSQSKISSYQDILYPSPWYWARKVTCEPEDDMEWKLKENKLYWRGSTTGGFSRAGGWKRQHRQQFVRKVNALDKAKILERSKLGSGGDAQWTIKEIPRQDMKPLMDVSFSGVGQCDPGDCDAQKEFFHLAGGAPQHEAWKYKYLLDLDGNAFSGRFYAFLKSQSLTFKMAVFREWHEHWIQPWVHYIPLSLRAEEALEAVRFFDQEDSARSMAVQMAAASTSWAEQALRKEDFEVWFFRLLLEYARIIDDDRASLGYNG